MKNTARYATSFGLVGIIALGRVHDSRLTIMGFDLSIIIFCFYIISIIISVLYRSGKHGVDIPQSRLYIYLSIPYLIAVVAISYTILIVPYNSIYTYNKLYTYLIITLPILSVLIIRSDVRYVSDVVYALAIVGVVLVLASLPAVLSSVIGRSDIGRSVSRLSVFGGGPIVYARWVLTAAIVLLFYDIKRFIKIPILLLLLLCSLMAQSKGPVAFFSISVALIYTIRAYSDRNLKTLSSTICAIVLIPWFVQLVIDQVGIGSRLLSLFNPSELRSATSTLARVEFISLSMTMISEYPLGVGLGNWGGQLISDGHAIGEYTYPHNLILELAAELGILVSILFVIWISYVSYRGIKSLANMHRYGSNRYGIMSTCICLMIFYLFNSMVSGDITDSRMLFIMTIMVAVMSEFPSRINNSIVVMKKLS